MKCGFTFGVHLVLLHALRSLSKLTASRVISRESFAQSSLAKWQPATSGPRSPRLGWRGAIAKAPTICDAETTAKLKRQRCASQFDCLNVSCGHGRVLRGSLRVVGIHRIEVADCSVFVNLVWSFFPGRHVYWAEIVSNRKIMRAFYEDGSAAIFFCQMTTM